MFAQDRNKGQKSIPPIISLVGDVEEVTVIQTNVFACYIMSRKDSDSSVP